MQTRPEQLCPGCVINHSRPWTDQGFDAPRRGQGSAGVEPARKPTPFLAIPEKLPRNAEIRLLGRSRNWLPQSLPDSVLRTGVRADVEPIDRSNIGGADLTRPVCRFERLGVLGGQPAANLQQHAAG